MKIDVKHIQKRGKAGWRYRRKIPEELRNILGKREILIPLGPTEAIAIKKYPRVHAEAEKLLLSALSSKQAPSPNSHQSLTALEQFKWGQQDVRRLQLDPEWSGADDEHDSEALKREVIAEQIAAKYPLNDEGNPTGISTKDAATLRALMYGARLDQPVPTLEDAKRLYLKERVGDDETKQMELERVFNLVKEALGKDRKLSSLKREDAKEVRDHMLDGRKASSVDRYLNVVRAMINHAIREFDLAGVINPFMNLEAAPKDKAEPDKDKRRPFTQAEVTAITARIAYHAKADLQYIWTILNGTGCRLAEVSGLRVADVHLDHAIPHITVEWHDDRRIKNKVSRRNVPLRGGALEAATEAVKAAGNATMLFPTYGRPKGASSASAALGKHVRACVTDPKATTHSLRHLMKDRLRLAGVSKSDQDIVLGHSSGSVGEDYGGDEARLEVARRALEKALGSGG
ncbi:tyrosine-type recombinase/integrase [Mesorhizobium sp. ESP6-5]|uniref:tyrosine-type recombinase/integrase n=1 Tax=Mesorhizobium sp. ESP6-5 TaxID=2876623 RepID=UPI001CCBF0C1|nr:tyrosine-type recombinase/integrase [Mesorhizobium sp. ESP6-5]MBZ9753674.1 tyrosine-type recombinase/integrase [Mesorhizobium sp. ESP6-5]